MKQLDQFLDEARKNPEKNPRQSGLDGLRKYLNDNSVFVHFSTLNKIGINPVNTYNTPYGIYCYPLTQVKKNMLDTNSSSTVPYAGERPYIHVLRHNGKGKFIHDVKSNYNETDLKKDLVKLKELYSSEKTDHTVRFKKIDNLIISLNGAVKRAVDIHKETWAPVIANKKEQEYTKQLTLINYSHNEYKKNRTNKDVLINYLDDLYRTILYGQTLFQFIDGPRGSIWITCRKLLGEIKKITEPIKDDEFDDIFMMAALSIKVNIPFAVLWNTVRILSKKIGGTSSNTQILWNKMLRQLGYAGFADRSGAGIIHPSEPVQAIFLSKEFVKHVEVIDNVTPATIINTMEEFEKYINGKISYDGIWDLIEVVKTNKFKDVYKHIYSHLVIGDRKKFISTAVNYVTSTPIMIKYMNNSPDYQRLTIAILALYLGNFSKVIKKNERSILNDINITFNDTFNAKSHSHPFVDNRIASVLGVSEESILKKAKDELIKWIKKNPQKVGKYRFARLILSQ